MSAAVTVPAPRFVSRTSISGESPCRRQIRFLKLSRMSVTSSRTPGSVVNSCATPSIFTEVTAAPSSDESSTRRSELPNVWPKPRSSGSITKTPRCSLTSSWVIFGTWKSITVLRADILSFRFELGALLGVELDDQLFLHRRVDLGALRPLQHLAGQALVVGLQPRGDGGGEVGRVANHLLGRGTGLEHDHVVGLRAVARDVHAATVDQEVAVPHELARLGARRSETKSVNDIVEPGLEHAQQVLAGDATLPRRLRVVAAELGLEQAVEAASLLLLAQLQQVLGLLDAAAAVLARRVAAALDRALLGQAALALQEELHPLAAALLALRSGVSRHLHTPPLLGPDAVVRLRRDVLDAEDLEAGRLERADCGLATGARALDEDLDFLETVLHALARGCVGGHLGRERCRLARALEARRAGRLPDDHVALRIGEADDRVVERSLDVGLS